MKLRNLVFCLLLLLLFIPGMAKAETETVGGYLQLTGNETADWSLSEDLYVDLNGYDLNGVIKTNGYAVYGMDSTTVEYECDSVGYFSCVDEHGAAIVPQRHVKTEKAMTGSVRRYMTIEEKNGYSFHRFFLAVTHVSLRPATDGLGYKVLFCGDFRVMEQFDEKRALQIELQLEGCGSVSVHKQRQDVESGAYVTVRIDNWDVENHSQTTLSATASLLLSDGTKISTSTVSTTLRQQVETISAKYEQITKAKLDLVRELIGRYPVMRTWDVDNLFISSYGFIDNPEVGKAYKFGVQIPDGTYYFSGAISGSYYLATTNDINSATDVYLEKVSGGYALYFMNGSTKTYINIVKRNTSGSTVKMQLQTTPVTYTLDTQYKYMSTKIGTRTFYMGTYTGSSGTYSTISGSNVTYISDKTTIGVTQFPAWLMGEGGYQGGLDTEPPEYHPELDGAQCQIHADADDNGLCDICQSDVLIELDLFAVNDLHGKFADGDSHPGVDELSTYFQNARAKNDNVVILSSGDMWQGAAESNLTKGFIVTEWMNELDFVSMTLGNHEYDWGEDAIRQNKEIAEFPFLAINVYDKSTGKQVDYAQNSVVVDLGEIEVGIIGAMGDVYSSIATDRSQNVTFKTGSELTALVKAEATKLRNEGVDVIIYSIHDGTSSSFSHYDQSLSNGYVDIVFEGHAHQDYCRTDSYGVYHLQGGGDNTGISQASISYNIANGNTKTNSAKVVYTTAYSSLADHAVVAQLLEKYKDLVSKAYEVLGRLTSKMSSSTILNKVAALYVEAGVERWGDQYDIVLGGGYLNTRSPYDLAAGEVTYGDLMNILPFDNRLALCSVSGTNLQNKFINSSSYYIAYSDYGKNLSISSSKTYYIIVDTYTAYYAPNNLTVIALYDEDVYARDLLAEYIEENY